MRAAPATLGHVYWSDHYAGHEDAILAELQSRWPSVAWVGCVGVGIAADGVEYFDEPALALMLAPLPAAQFEVWSGASRLQRIQPHAALVHADPATPDLAELVAEMSERTAARYVFGGLASSRRDAVHIADGVLRHRLIRLKPGAPPPPEPPGRDGGRSGREESGDTQVAPRAAADA